MPKESAAHVPVLFLSVTPTCRRGPHFPPSAPSLLASKSQYSAETSKTAMKYDCLPSEALPDNPQFHLVVVSLFRSLRHLLEHRPPSRLPSTAVFRGPEDANKPIQHGFSEAQRSFIPLACFLWPHPRLLAYLNGAPFTFALSCCVFFLFHPSFSFPPVPFFFHVVHFFTPNLS